MVQEIEPARERAGTHNNESSETLRVAAESNSNNLSKQRQTEKSNTQELVSKGTLPSLELSSNGKKEWTLAVHLAATLPGGPEQVLGYGADHKLAQLKQLAKDTEGKPVNLLVNVERTTDRKGALCHAEGKTPEKAAACDKSAVEANRAVTERYFIHDGQIERLPNSTYKASGPELSQLLKDAQRLSPSSKLGLIIQSHGAGPEGIKTNKGDLSLSAMLKSIQRGLEPGQKLDMLNFDACIMGNDKVLDKSSEIAKNLVASAAVESANKVNDGQNVSAAIKSLTENPNLSGRELADNFVEQAKNGENGKGIENTTMTLASFDLTRFQSFKQSLDSFGKELNAAAGNDANLKAIQDAVNATTIPETGAEEHLNQQRDLKNFAKNIQEAIESGKIKSPDGKLEQATRDFLKNFDELATRQFGEAARGYERMGGLTTNLPGKEILDKKETAALMSPFRVIAHQVKSALIEGVKLNDKSDLIKGINETTKELGRALGGSSPQTMKELKEAISDIAKSKNEEEYRSALKNFQSVAESIDASPLGQRIRKELEKDAPQVRREYFANRKEAITAGWCQFQKFCSADFKSPVQQVIRT
ncbi:MAG: hypothetical protein K2X27_03895 [Candidatus Obscuribacterales bacterium]|nr:hypothetical protein [Candidatus Obscuribacterales bacterium]